MARSLYIRYDFLPQCEPVASSKKKVRLCKDWYFWVGNVAYWIPAGYIFDGASIPRIFWTLIGSPFQPDFWAAALAHDWLYLTHLVGRKIADDVIYQILRQSGVNTFKAHVIWAAVRGCAAWAWDNGTEDLTELQRIKNEVSQRQDHAKFGM
jgi:hypothetical protein